MMFRMSFSKDALHAATIQFEPLSVVRYVYSLFVDRQDVAVNLASLVPAVDGLGTCNKFRGIDHVACATRMNNTAGRWQLTHQGAGAAGVVEVYVR